MDKFMYALILGGVGWVVASALYGGVIFARLTRHVKQPLKRRYAYMAMAKLAFGLTSAVLLARVIASGESEATVWAWLYAVGSFATGYAFTGIAKSGVDELAAFEVDAQFDVRQTGRTLTRDRVDRLEGRMEVEETRNTAIEHLARQHKAGTEPDPSTEHQIEEENRQ